MQPQIKPSRVSGLSFKSNRVLRLDSMKSGATAAEDEGDDMTVFSDVDASDSEEEAEPVTVR